MPLFQLSKTELAEIATASFESLGYKEREDLQRLLRERIEIIVPDGFVVAEEFADWDESKRRIDLLVLDRNANLVIVELKRTEDGGHSELQALRYAAMISTITFDQVVEAHRNFLARLGIREDPQTRILKFLAWNEPDDDRFGQDVRVVLASADFSKELTTTVLWLNDQGLDIRCVRMRPYAHDGKVILDVQQLLPLPETQEYQVRVREKLSSEKSARQGQTERQRRNLAFWAGLLKKAGERSTLHQSISPSKDNWATVSSRGLGMSYVLARGGGRVELYINRTSQAENKSIYDELYLQRAQIEAEFGDTLNWERLDGKLSSRVFYVVPSTGTEEEEGTWDQLQTDLIDHMLKLEAVLGSRIQKYRDGENFVVRQDEHA
ncbi:DUF4268 domain-containing protein [Rosistilla oblonga]|uniref:DUF4268 domain-containing protein n=1 Tax=Rosistilla oblonga TaxID=2527990 RepID=A0A518IT75_9BACT|nr:DUF4268 domain-containing protein [Rosistilla oblonga]QDV56289.1 hypothetical protein Mal33_22710 [Rosistilla oblonga]